MGQFRNTLSIHKAKSYLHTDFIGRKIYYFNTIDSTNTKAKELALEEREGVLVVAEEQTKGRGRLGRDWTSPKGKGLYFSIILKPNMEAEKIGQITLIGAAAVSKALEEQGIGVKIKWPNDIIINNKKVCGILTEIGFLSNKPHYCIMGIGINVNLDREDIPEGIRDKATSLKIATNKKISRESLLGSILNYFESFYVPFKEKGDILKPIEISREFSLLIGKKVRLIKGKQEEIGRVLNINEKGELVVKFSDGRIGEVFSGEASVRGINGYI